MQSAVAKDCSNNTTFLVSREALGRSLFACVCLLRSWLFLMHAYAARSTECRAVTVSYQPAPYTWVGIVKPAYSSPAFTRTARFAINKRSAFVATTVSRAGISSNGAGSPRQTVTSDRDGTLGPQARVPANDAVNLSSSTSRPPITPSVLRSYEVPLWGRPS